MCEVASVGWDAILQTLGYFRKNKLALESL